MDDNVSNNILNQIFRQTFQVKNIGGFSQLAAQKITIIIGFFHNIRAQSSTICQITTKGEGLVSIFDSDVQSAFTDISLSITLYGGFSIDSFNSLLNLKIKNVTFIENYNKFGSSIMTLVPSQKQNKIEIVNVIVKNCLSLINQVFVFEFSGQQTIMNKVKIQNMTFNLEEKSWVEYFNLIQDINEFDVEKILSSNSIISISGSDVRLSYLQFSGIILGQILKIINSQNIQVTHMKAYDIFQIYPDNLMFFGQNEQNKEKIAIIFSEIKNCSQYFPKNQILFQQNLIFSKENNQCPIIKDYFTITQQNKNYIDYIYLFQKQSSNIGSLVYFSATSNLTQIKIIRLNIENNNQHQFSSAINLNLNSFDSIVISEFYCIKNQFKNFGCLQFYSASTLNKQITVSNSFFSLNEGLSGSAINAENINLKVKSCKFMNNTASEQGGAINYNGANLVLKSSYIFYNKARIGGGLVTISSQINFNQLQSFYLKLNYASFVSDNILSQPTHLSLQINNFQMPSQIIKSENQTIYQLKVKPYKTIEQERDFSTKYLMLPTNSIINDYYLLGPKNLERLQQIFSIKITLRNIYDEILPNQSNCFCVVNQGIQSNLESEVKTEPIEGQLQFDSLNNQFEFDKLKIIQDPYLINESFLILITQCSSTEYTLNYKIISQVYKCQLGEYYIEKIGCQICNPTQGYYSVTYDVTKCQLFDKTKYKSITSNQIELLPGFWRYNKYSDNAELCFKYLKFCLGGWSTGNQLCKKGNIGGLCEECDIENLRGNGHYYKDSQNHECWDCGKSTNGLIGFCVILLWTFFSTFLTLSSIKQSYNQFSSLKSMHKYGKIIFKLNQDHQSFLIKMLINYLWIFSAIFTFNITFSFQANAVEQASNPSFFMANSLDCLLQGTTQFQITYLRVIVAVLLIFAQFCLIAITQIIFEKLKNKGIDRSIFSNTIVYLYLQNSGSIIKQLSSLLSQRSISEVLYVSGDTSLLYNSENHFNWLKYFILPLLIIVSIIIPIFLLLLLLINRDKLNSIKIRKHLGYLLNDYKDKNFFWELVKILKQSIIILFLIMFETKIFIKAIVVGFILILYQLFVASYVPFALKNFNVLDLQSGQLCLVGIFLGALKYQTEQDENNFYSEFLQIVIIFVLIRICFPFVSKILAILIKKEKLQILRKIIQFFSWIQTQSRIAEYLKKYVDQQERDKKNLQNNIGKIRQRFFKQQPKILTLEQRLLPSTTFITSLSPQNNQKQRLQMDFNISSQKIAI